MFERYQNGEANFQVLKEVDGKEKEIYRNDEGMHFGGCIKYKGKRIGGNFGIWGFFFSLSSGMMKRDEGIAQCIDELVPFFEYFETLLSQTAKNDMETSNSNTNEKNKMKTLETN